MRNWMRLASLALVCCLASNLNLHAADWNQWRGPDRDGVAPSGPLAESWPKAGPRRLWQSESIPSGGAGGLGSPVVAGGKVYLYVNRRYVEPIATRRLSDQGLRALGWTPQKPPADVLGEVEKARLSEQRQKLTPKEVNGWVKKWLAEKLNEEQRKKFGGWIADRLRRGKAAFAMESLEKLAEIRNKEFASKEALAEWLRQSGLPPEVKKAAVGQIPTTANRYTDVVLCLDAADSKRLWRREYPGRGFDPGASPTPLVTGGRVYVIGSLGVVYCLDAGSGELAWKKQLDGAKGARVSSSFAIADGLLVILAGPLTAMDAATGEVRWTQPKVSGADNSPAFWHSGGKHYVICNTGRSVFCVDPADGKLLWNVPGGSCSTPALAGDVMAVQAESKQAGLSAYRLSPEKPEKLWTVEHTDRGASPIIHDGHVYSVTRNGAICVNVETGKVLWKQNVGGGEISSPILAGGVVLSPVGAAKGVLVMIKASPEKFSLLGKVQLGIATCSSPAFVHGKLYVRLGGAVACYDLSAAANTTQPAAAR
jgi:outer membrane protein assembly factor BamB